MRRLHRSLWGPGGAAREGGHSADGLDGLEAVARKRVPPGVVVPFLRDEPRAIGEEVIRERLAVRECARAEPVEEFDVVAGVGGVVHGRKAGLIAAVDAPAALADDER